MATENLSSTQDENQTLQNNMDATNLPDNINAAQVENEQAPEEAIVSEAKKKKTTKPNIAKNSYEKAQQAIRVAKLWMKTNYVLSRFTAEKMLELGQQLLLALVAKSNTKVQRNPLTTKLTALYNEATKSGSRVKAYFKGDFDKAEAETKYPEVGFKYSKQYGYRWPFKREEFLAGLDIMLIGLETYGYADREFGVAYWTDLKQRYEQIFIDAGLHDIKFSEEVGSTSELEDEVHGMLVSVKKLVEAENYGNEDRALRNMGYMREKN